jgi:HD-like signal output (HDOD) protein
MGLLDSLRRLLLPQAISKSGTASYRQDHASKPLAQEAIEWTIKNRAYYTRLEDKYYQYFIGVNSLLALELNAFEQNVIRSLNKTLSENTSLVDEIPRLPDVIPKLIHILRNEHFSWREIADLISTDPVILLNVIKIASSPNHQLNMKQQELEQILMDIGYSEVRSIIMRLSLKPIMQFEGGHFLKHSATKIWIHAVKTAISCRDLAVTFKQDPFDAYLTGLLHNLGMTIVVKHMNDIKQFTHAPRSLEFKVRLLDFSRQFSIRIARQWEVEPAVIQALEAIALPAAEEMHSPLAHLLYQASAISMKHILVRENRWNENDNSYDIGTEFIRIYQKLDTMTL